MGNLWGTNYYGEPRLWPWAIVAALVVAVPIGAWMWSEPFDWHERGGGMHVGYVTSVEQSGTFWVTWDVHFKTDTQSTQEDTYCVRPAMAESLIPVLRDMSERHVRVEITFKNYLATDASECKGFSAITAVREV